MSDHDRDLQRRIRERAYTLWQEAGSPSGRDQEFWHRALELEQVVPAHGSAGANGSEPAPADADDDSASAEDAAAESAERTAVPWWRRLF